MSNPLGSDAAELIPAYTTTFDEAALQIGLITEVNLFWRNKITGATVLFIVTRYLVLISFAIVAAVTFASMSVESCTALQRAQYVLSLFLYPLWATFSALRTLALSGMNRPLAGAVFILAMTPFVVDIWPMALDDLSGTNVPRVGCAGVETVTNRQRIIYVSLARGSTVISDMVVVIVTWATWRKGGDYSLPGLVPTLSNILMYNGTIYFLLWTSLLIFAMFVCTRVVGICSTAHLVLTLSSIEAPLERYSMVTALTDPANQAALGRDTVGGTRSYGEALAGLEGPLDGTLRFVSFAIGSIGESLADPVPVDDTMAHGEE
ncbi:hypothetical protein C2E23DRAFT_860274 [Lenzites betulinus]|nr:hypothetical protein C2E23DRAFT_860274 [Lenzites betulinus]